MPSLLQTYTLTENPPLPVGTDVGQDKTTSMSESQVTATADAVETAAKEASKNNRATDKNFFIFPPLFSLRILGYAPLLE
jgi:hypothetical protein